MKEEFYRAINNKLKVRVTFNAKEEGKGQVTRTCIPFDFGASQRVNVKDKTEKYHVLDLDTPDPKGPHPIALRPEQITRLEVLNENFDPGDYIKGWTLNWIYKRDWGIYS